MTTLLSFKVKNFGPIKERIIFEPKDFSIIIGEQASGKSIIAKLIFLFRSLRDDVMKWMYEESDRLSKGSINRVIRNKFLKFFGRNPQRIFIFDNVENGKTVMATVRIGKFLSYMVPPIIILLNTKKSNVHRFAKVVAELEGIGLYCTELDKKEFLKLIDEIIL
jgi:predicted transcriptional regulator